MAHLLKKHETEILLVLEALLSQFQKPEQDFPTDRKTFQEKEVQN